MTEERSIKAAKFSVLQTWPQRCFLLFFFRLRIRLSRWVKELQSGPHLVKRRPKASCHPCVTTHYVNKTMQNLASFDGKKKKM